MAAGQVVDVTVVGAFGLKDKETFTRQDPYVILEYGNQRFRSKTDIDGGTNPAFNFCVSLRVVPGVYDFSLVIWNENNLRDNVVGSTRINFQRVLSTGFEDSSWPVYNKKQAQRGSVRIIMRTAVAHAAHSQYPAQSHYSSPYAAVPPATAYGTTPYAAPSYSQPHGAYPPPPSYPTPYPPAPSASPYGAPPPAYGTAPYPAAGHPPAYGQPPAYGAYPPAPYPGYPH